MTFLEALWMGRRESRHSDRESVRLRAAALRDERQGCEGPSPASTLSAILFPPPFPREGKARRTRH
jgi:hypothetical protein